MNDQPKPTPVIVRTHKLLADAERMIRNEKLSGAQVELWVIEARTILGRVFGEESPQYLGCSSPGHDPATRTQHERLSLRIPFIAGLHESLARSSAGRKIFIGHGRSLQWLILKDFLTANLRLNVDEFNIEPTAGIHTTERLQAMLGQAGLAFIIMTGEDTLADGTIQARPNVFHEVGLFQGYLGTRRAIVMHETGCASFSNIDGLTTIHFPKDNLAAKFEEIRRVLIREGYLAAT
jgi:hypothetical protein